MPYFSDFFKNFRETYGKPKPKPKPPIKKNSKPKPTPVISDNKVSNMPRMKVPKRGKIVPGTKRKPLPKKNMKKKCSCED